MTERFAIYFAPAEDSVLWRRAASWIGRDAVSGEMLPQPVSDSMSSRQFADLTEDARRYGFHATLRSPFSLADTVSPEQLQAEMARFAGEMTPLALGAVDIRDLMGFLALMPVTENAALTAFAAACVSRFEPFRKPLSAKERARRLGSELTARQIELVEKYGYPYVMEEFRFHMTLTDRLDETTHAAILAAARAYFAEVLATPLVIDRIVLFHEPEPGLPFYRLGDFVLTGTNRAYGQVR